MRHIEHGWHILPKLLVGEFRAFDESVIARPFKKQQPLDIYKRCNSHHPAKNYSRVSSCNDCGSANLSTDVCMVDTKCRNYSVPLCSDIRRYLVRPTRFGESTKEQMKMYRQMEEREYQAVPRAIAAEENTVFSESIILDAPSSQNFEN